MLVEELHNYVERVFRLGNISVVEKSVEQSLPHMQFRLRASFYELFSLKPLGRHVIRFCESAPCHVMGGREVIQALEEELELRPGETSSDMKWSLLTTSCIGVCGVGPVFVVDEDVYGNVTPGQVREILARYD